MLMNAAARLLRTQSCIVAVGALVAATAVCVTPRTAAADSLDVVLRRLEALENSNSKLEKENAMLRERMRRIEGNKPVVVPTAAPAMATAQAASAGVGSSAGVTKAPPRSFLDATTLTLYGHADLSFDWFDNGVRDPTAAPDNIGGRSRNLAVSSNLSYFGVRATHDLSRYGYEGWAALLQYETLVETASTPSERAALGSRDSYLGIRGPYGAIKLGKSDTPYKRSTALFDPFRNTVGDYNSIMGNTGGDARAEFDARLPHSIWYESPTIGGFQFSALFSPGQNLAQDFSANPLGEFNCSGSTPRSSGSGFPADPFGAGICTDGSFGNAYSAALTFKHGWFTAIAAYERHDAVNRLADEGIADTRQPQDTGPNATVFAYGLPVTGVGIKPEWAAKGGIGLNLPTNTQIYGIFEHMEREGTTAIFNERTRNGTFVSATQTFGPWEFSASWAHAFKTPGDPAGNAGTAGDPQNQADMYAAGARYNFDKDFRVYLVGALLQNGPGAHYCLGPSGHGFSICSRDGTNATQPGTDIKAVSVGLRYLFSADIMASSAPSPALVTKN